MRVGMRMRTTGHEHAMLCYLPSPDGEEAAERKNQPERLSSSFFCYFFFCWCYSFYFSWCSSFPGVIIPISLFPFISLVRSRYQLRVFFLDKRPGPGLVRRGWEIGRWTVEPGWGNGQSVHCHCYGVDRQSIGRGKTKAGCIGRVGGYTSMAMAMGEYLPRGYWILDRLTDGHHGGDPGSG